MLDTATEIDSDKSSQVIGAPDAGLKSDLVQTPTDAVSEGSDTDFLAGTIAADPDSFNVCISCD